MTNEPISWSNHKDREYKVECPSNSAQSYLGTIGISLISKLCVRAPPKIPDLSSIFSIKTVNGYMKTVYLLVVIDNSK